MKIKQSPPSTTGTPPAAMVVAEYFQKAVQFHQQGQLAPAQLAYRQVLQMEPNHAQALHLLGVLAFQTGNHAIAAELIGKAIAIDASHAAFYCNLGNVQLKLGQPSAAIGSYERAIGIKSDFADALGNRGVALAELRQFEAAVASYDQAVAANPRYAEAFSNRGTALLNLGKLEEAIASWDIAISLRPDYAEAHCARGVALQQKGISSEAMKSFHQALEANPNLSEAHCNLAALLLDEGRPELALASYVKALRTVESIEGKRGFAQCIKRVSSSTVDPSVQALLMRAIAEAWTRPSQLLAPAVQMLKQNPAIRSCMEKAYNTWPAQLSQEDLFAGSGLAAIAHDPMLRCILECIPIASIEMERFLTQARRVLLDLSWHSPASVEHNGEGDPVLSLLCAVARQCHLNEYVFQASAEELAIVEALRGRLEANISAQLPVSGRWLAAVAAYSSLRSLQSANPIEGLTWPEPIRGLLRQQIDEPAKEQEYRPLIPKITPIADDVSLLVQAQYEANPYPRWVKTSGTIQMGSTEAYLRQLFPASPIRQCSTDGAADILIAGCGTGQQSIDTALLFPTRNVLAIDLSMSSLCYAKRKTEELGLQNIQYAQADIMALGTLDRKFDTIESVGVLHHMADPLAGWKVLLGLLRPGGFMRLGLYSELARQSVVAAREHIAKRGYAATATDIRLCRQELMSQEKRTHFGKLFSFRDFFAMSECRDLIFHVQEHRFNLVQVKFLLRELGLNFVGFNLDSPTTRRYHASFPEDTSLTNLDSWAQFEIENPDTFAGMYQFWVQKVDG